MEMSVNDIAETHNLNVTIPPSLIIGFDDNRLVYTSRANKAMKVKFAKPNYEGKLTKRPQSLTQNN